MGSQGDNFKGPGIVEGVSVRCDSFEIGHFTVTATLHKVG